MLNVWVCWVLVGLFVLTWVRWLVACVWVFWVGLWFIVFVCVCFEVVYLLIVMIEFYFNDLLYCMYY